MKQGLDKVIEPFCIAVPISSGRARKCGGECCSLCRTCIYHRPNRKDRLCLFRECPFLQGLSTSTYQSRKENHKRDRKRSKK